MVLKLCIRITWRVIKIQIAGPTHSIGLRWGLRICISDKLAAAAAALKYFDILPPFAEETRTDRDLTALVEVIDVRGLETFD